MLALIFLIISAVLLFLAAFGVVFSPRFHFGWAGVFFLVLSLLAPHVSKL